MKQGPLKIFWITLGLISLGVGIIGAILPLLPSFPFLMLTLFSFAKSSEKLHSWFLGTKIYKENLESYVVSKSMKMSTKIRIIFTVTVVMGFGFYMMDKVPVGRIVLGFVWVFHVLYFIFGVKTLKHENRKSKEEIRYD
ncbi:uncharacterized membrane protein YbaN (DUF454 family) [Aequitasia blattaphilus]|uniref:YbaN family protein n=1 Tax=Aequitasia blattaphilus TaxID=2949332 RepID=A0ABT1E732_9FIRM|nr:YbaN family protein [Aequitasia blattaphilus]MCP1101641.1 YbaN family protein [Aequitasia blattaphilus]MCR8614281.1 YbaN family protein [Aequitasia blattaphilus]